MKLKIKDGGYDGKFHFVVQRGIAVQPGGPCIHQLFPNAAWDLVGEDYRTVATTKYLRPDDYIYVSADELDPAPDGTIIYNRTAQPASQFKGEGVRIRKVVIQGPLEAVWPPQRTRNLFPGVAWEFRTPNTRGDDRYYHAVLTQQPLEHIRDSVPYAR